MAKRVAPPDHCVRPTRARTAGRMEMISPVVAHASKMAPPNHQAPAGEDGSPSTKLPGRRTLHWGSFDSNAADTMVPARGSHRLGGRRLSSMNKNRPVNAGPRPKPREVLAVTQEAEEPGWSTSRMSAM